MIQDQKHVIYVSYADADEDWVIVLVNGLKVYLRKQLGRIGDNFIWAKYMLSGNENRLTIPQQHLQKSRYLLTVLLPAYMATMGDSEINLFKNTDNILVVECGKTNRAEKLKFSRSYQFWHEDNTGSVVRWADPEPLPNERKYYRLLDQMSRYIIKNMQHSKDRDIPEEQVFALPHESQPISEVFISTTEEDRAVALDIQKHLNGNIASSLPPSSKVGLSPKEVQKDLEKKLLECDTAIIICDQAPLKWVYQQVQFILKLSVKRRKENKSDIKVIVLNKPPPDNLKELLGFQFPNFEVYDCADITSDCIPCVKEAILS